MPFPFMKCITLYSILIYFKVLILIILKCQMILLLKDIIHMEKHVLENVSNLLCLSMLEQIK